MDHTKSACIQKYQARLDEWDAYMDKLETKAGQVDAQAKIQLSSYLEQLKAKRRLVQEGLDELREASNDGWHEVERGLDDAARDFSDAPASMRLSL